LAWIALEILDVFIDFVLCRPTVAFDAFADKVEVLKRNSRQATFFSRNFNQITERPNLSDCARLGVHMFAVLSH